VTQNKDVLISDYRTRIDNNNIGADTEESIVNDTVALIEVYVEKMRESGNTNITSEFILDSMEELDPNGSSGEQIVTYDGLIYSLREHSETKEHLLIDTAYAQYVINVFTECTGACKDQECLSSPLTCTQLTNPEYNAIKHEIEAEIKTLVADLAELYTLTMETNEEYNYYLGASYISVLSSASVKPSVNVNLYTFIAFFFLIVVCCGGAIVLCRIADIIQRTFYTDTLTEFNNRAYFDKYLKSMDQKLLNEETVYCIVDIANLAYINSTHTRESGDAVIKLFAKYLKDAFGKTSAEYIYNGHGSFAVLANGVDSMAVEDIMRLFAARLDQRGEYRHIKMEYRVGMAESTEVNRTARKLLVEAIENKRDVSSAAYATRT
jgi:GGDEF domain-containing protein